MLPVVACVYCYEWHLIMLIYMLIYALSGSLSQFVWSTQLSFLHLYELAVIYYCHCHGNLWLVFNQAIVPGFTPGLEEPVGLL